MYVAYTHTYTLSLSLSVSASLSLPLSQSLCLSLSLCLCLSLSSPFIRYTSAPSLGPPNHSILYISCQYSIIRCVQTQ